MNRSFSFSSAKIHNHKKCPVSEAPKAMMRKKRREKHESRRAFEHSISNSSSNNNNNNNNLCSSSGSGSIEAPKGCLKFLLSHSPSSSTAHYSSKTPKSAPVVKDKSFFKPISHKLDRVPKSRKPTSKIPLLQDSIDAAPIIKPPEEGLQFTPVASSKFSTCSTLDVVENHNNVSITDDDKSCTSSDKTKTPPIQASFSPEIQSSTISAATPACYGAGHLLSGVTDRRKCKARGVLTVAQPSDNEWIDPPPQQDYPTGNVNQSSISLLPSPAEASMHWLLSPCLEDDEDDKENSAPLRGLNESTMLSSPSSPVSDLHFSFDLCNLSTSGSNKSERTKINMLISPQLSVRLDSLYDYNIDSSSPNATPNSGAVAFKDEARNCYDKGGGNSPLSANTLGSENVMQTPNSDSSLERNVKLSCSNENDSKRLYSHSELLSLSRDLQNASIFPTSRVSIWDTTSSSFQFHHSSSPSNSMDLSPFQKILDDHSLWNSTSTFENLSLSQMKISWREGLVSQGLDTDEFDTCRCLSDKEGDLNVKSSDRCKSCKSLENIADGESKEKVRSRIQCSFAESICTDADGLCRSDDSNWNLCYKGNTFEV